ncbi:hypothetical protein DMS22_20840 [Klebsiella variicola]|nr:hypothetical protein DMS22_20840 [Klebsiella variicola]
MEKGCASWHLSLPAFARRQAPSRNLASVSQVQELNRFHTRGYVLVGLGALCYRMRQATGQRALLILQSNKLLY